MEDPMGTESRSNFLFARAAVFSASGALCAIVLSPPFFFAAGWHTAAAAVYFFLSPFCHHMPERSFWLLGIPLAACHRCAGIYLGLFLGSWMNNRRMHRSPSTRRRWVFAAAVPMVLDAMLPHLGLWANTTASRFATGLCFGIVVASLLVRGFAEFLDEAPWRRFAFGDTSLTEASYERR